MFETHFQNVLREGPARFFKQQAQIAGRDTELAGDGCRAQCWIAHVMFHPANNCGTPHGPYAASLHKLTRVAFGSERQRDEVDDMLAVKLRRTRAVFQVDIDRAPEIS